MSEKHYCGQCEHIKYNGYDELRLPILYCPVIDRVVAFAGYACPEFQKRGGKVND